LGMITERNVLFSVETLLYFLSNVKSYRSKVPKYTVLLDYNTKDYI